LFVVSNIFWEGLGSFAVVRHDQPALYPEDHELLEDKEHQASNDSGETFFVASLALFTVFQD
jgi:hypothetical protein